MDRTARSIPLAILALAVSCGSGKDTRTDSTTGATASAVRVVAPPVRPVPYFVGEEGTDATAEGRQATVTDVKGTATWTIERDPLDLRRKVTIRIVLNTPNSTLIILRTIDSMPPAPGMYRMMVPGTGASHHVPFTIHGEIRTTEAGRPREYIPVGFDADSVRIDSARGPADSTLRGRIRLRGGRFSDAKPGVLLRDNVEHNVIGNFIAPPAGAMAPGDFVSPAMQEAVLRRALDGFVITNSGAINGDGNADSTTTPGLARAFLENRWDAAAVIEELRVNGQSYHVRLRGRFVPTTCEVDSRDERINCR